MPKVLTTKAQIMCPHGFKGQSQSFDPTWSINGNDVLVEGDRGLLPCTNIVPCVGYTLRSMGLNATLIKGKKVVLVTDFNQTDTGLPLTMSEFHDVVDDTTPAPIPDGQTAPPLPPPIADITTTPIVSVEVPAPFVFNKTTGTPLELEATFKLESPHPLRWILTLLHEQPPPNADFEDLTDSQPGGLTLSATDGTWNVSPLEIKLKMTKAYMETLLNIPPFHRFFMTGVNQRGLSSSVELLLTANP